MLVQYLSYVYNRTSFFQRSRHHANTQPSGYATRLRSVESDRISCVNVDFKAVRCTTVYLWRKLSQVRTSRCRSTIDGKVPWQELQAERDQWGGYCLRYNKQARLAHSCSTNTVFWSSGKLLSPLFLISGWLKAHFSLPWAPSYYFSVML